MKLDIGSLGEHSRAINRLKAGSKDRACAEYLRSISELHRLELYNHLEYERLNRKYNDIMAIYREHGENWNQTLYMQFFATLSDQRNKRVYLELARRVPYSALLRERNSLMRVEALLIGASGLLDVYCDDHYASDLRRESEYLFRKYDITPLQAEDWDLYKIFPKNLPTVRLAQAAQLFSQNEFLLDKVLSCQTRDDVERIFSVEASQYWSTHYVPAKSSDEDIKRLGSFKCNIIGINLVTMIQFAYGYYTSNDALCDRAKVLLERLKAEDNTIIKRWVKRGLKPVTAFDTQALLQLDVEYCARKRCSDCPVGSRAMQSFSWLG